MTDEPLHILIPTDLRFDERGALQLVMQFDPMLRARLTLLHVVSAADFRAPKQGFGAIEHLRDTLRLPAGSAHACPTISSRVERELADAVQRLRKRVHPEWNGYLEIQAVSRRGEVAAEILSFAETARVDMILLAAKPRQPWWKWSRSVNDQVIRRAKCRVVLVHNPCSDGGSGVAIDKATQGMKSVAKQSQSCG